MFQATPTNKVLGTSYWHLVVALISDEQCRLILWGWSILIVENFDLGFENTAEAARYLLNNTSIYIFLLVYFRIHRFSGVPWWTF